MVLRHKAQLLAAITQAFAREAAATERHHRLVSLQARVPPGFLDVQPGVDAPGTHRIMVDE